MRRESESSGPVPDHGESPISSEGQREGRLGWKLSLVSALWVGRKGRMARAGSDYW